MANLGLPRELTDLPRPYLQINDGSIFGTDFPVKLPSDTGPGADETFTPEKDWAILGGKLSSMTTNEGWEYNFVTRPQAPTVASNFVIPEDGVYSIASGLSVTYKNPPNVPAQELQQYFLVVAANPSNDGFSAITGIPDGDEFLEAGTGFTEVIHGQRLHPNETSPFIVSTDSFARQTNTYTAKKTSGLKTSTTTYLKKGTRITFFFTCRFGATYQNLPLTLTLDDFYASIALLDRPKLQIYQGQAGTNSLRTEAQRANRFGTLITQTF
jgi:hypothetical protein